MRPKRIEPGAGQESVWDYPRPPALDPITDRIRVIHRGVVIGDSVSAVRILETSQPPAYYLPRSDIADGVLVLGGASSWCEWKGRATYWTVVADGERVHDVAWSYEQPTAGFRAIAGHVAFYAQHLDQCWVGDEQVMPNPGNFYGGWITSRIVGPFKGGPGTSGW